MASWDKVLTEQAGPFIHSALLILTVLQSVDVDKEFVDAISISPREKCFRVIS